MELRRKVLLLAGAGSCGMAAVHFLLPHAYGWRQYLDLVPPALASATLAAHFLFSFLLLWGGCLTVMAAVQRKPIGGARYAVFYALGVFWTVYVVYQAQVPPPVPVVVRKLLLTLATLIALLYLIFLLTRRVAGRVSSR